MTFIENSTAPPFILYQPPTAGLKLKATSASAARSKIDRLLACGEDVAIDDATIDVLEPCSPALVKALYGVVEKNVGMRGGGRPREDVAEIVARVGHPLDSLATEAWERLGTPRYTGFWQSQDTPGEFHIIWSWQHHDGVPPAVFDTWNEFLAKHQSLIHTTYVMRVEIRAWWSFRFRSTKSGTVSDPYPRSTVRAYLAGKRPNAFLQLVMPHSMPSFRTDYKAVCKALEMELPLDQFKLSRPPKQAGGRRSLGKLKL
jgi:hypothetical protein